VKPQQQQPKKQQPKQPQQPVQDDSPAASAAPSPSAGDDSCRVFIDRDGEVITLMCCDYGACVGVEGGGHAQVSCSRSLQQYGAAAAVACCATVLSPEAARDFAAAQASAPARGGCTKTTTARCLTTSLPS
jgi:hypothetical protein